MNVYDRFITQNNLSILLMHQEFAYNGWLFLH